MAKAYEILPSAMGTGSSRWAKGAAAIAGGAPLHRTSGASTGTLPYVPAGEAANPSTGRQPKAYEMMPAPGAAARGLGGKSGGCGCNGGCGAKRTNSYEMMPGTRVATRGLGKPVGHGRSCGCDDGCSGQTRPPGAHSNRADSIDVGALIATFFSDSGSAINGYVALAKAEAIAATFPADASLRKALATAYTDPRKALAMVLVKAREVLPSRFHLWPKQPGQFPLPIKGPPPGDDAVARACAAVRRDLAAANAMVGLIDQLDPSLARLHQAIANCQTMSGYPMGRDDCGCPVPPNETQEEGRISDACFDACTRLFRSERPLTPQGCLNAAGNAVYSDGHPWRAGQIFIQLLQSIHDLEGLLTAHCGGITPPPNPGTRAGAGLGLEAGRSRRGRRWNDDIQIVRNKP